MIAVSLGVALCYVGFATLRLASQSVAMTNKLSVENNLLRLAMHDTMEELDFWKSYDDPNDPLKQKLRAVGRPFQPLAFDREEFQLEFTHANPRTWWRGSYHSNVSKRLGDYALFSNTNPTTSPERRWYGTMIDTLYQQLGGYAVADYMPNNAIYSLFNDSGAVPAYIAPAGSGGGKFYGKWVSDKRARGQLALTHNCAYCITLDEAYLASDVHRAAFCGSASGMWNDGNVWGAAAATPVNFMTIKPDHFPSVGIAVWHQYSFGLHQYGNIGMTNPVSGKITSIYLALTTTTLRGARRQRNLDSEAILP
jgi:hypothetical protein